MSKSRRTSDLVNSLLVNADNSVNIHEGTQSPYFQLDTAATPTLLPGMFGWNDVDGTADLRLKGGNVTLQLGQENVVRVVNKTGADLLESQYKVVRVRIASEGGSQGQRLAVVLAQGNNDPDSVTTLGIVTENIANNQEGFITVFGNVSEINTTGSLQGETWVDGDVLFLSPTTPGQLTNIKPTAPNHTVVMGYVVYAHAVHGKIFVKVDNGYELEELHDVLPTPYVNKGVLYRDTATNLWKSATIATLLGGTPLLTVPTLAQVTSAGNTTTNSITVGGLTSNGSFTASGAIARGIYFNNTLVAAANNDVLVGLDINPTFTNGAFTGVQNWGLRVQNSSILLTSNKGIYFGNSGYGISGEAGTGTLSLYTNSTERLKISYAGVITASGNARFANIGLTGSNIEVLNGLWYFNIENDGYGLQVKNVTNSNTVPFKIFRNDNVAIGTTTDAGYKLDVNGTARIQGLLAVNQVQSSGSISGASYFDVYGVGPAFRLYDNTYSTLYGGIGTYRWATGTAGNDTTILSNTGLGINFIVNGGTTPKATLTSNGTFLVGATTAGYDASLGYMIGAKSNTTQSLISFATSTQTLGAQGMIVGLDGYTGYVWMRSGINLSFGTNDIHRMQITGGGNVLINTTTNAGYKLDVNGSSRIQERLTITGNSGFDNPLTIITDKGGEYGTVYVGNTTNTGTSLVILHNNVGGQYSYNSYAFMGVAGNAYSYSTFGVNASNKFVLGAGGASNLGMYIGTVSAQPLVFNTNNAEVARFVSGGNFLIGTATDTGEKLQVNGTVRASAFSIGATAGWTGTINIPTNPPGQQNIDVQGGIVVNVF